MCASKQTLACQSDSILVNTTLFFTSSVWVCAWVRSKQVCEVSWQVCAVSHSTVSTEPLVAFWSWYRDLWPLLTSSPHSHQQLYAPLQLSLDIAVLAGLSSWHHCCHHYSAVVRLQYLLLFISCAHKLLQGFNCSSYQQDIVLTRERKEEWRTLDD